MKHTELICMHGMESANLFSISQSVLKSYIKKNIIAEIITRISNHIILRLNALLNSNLGTSYLRRLQLSWKWIIFSQNFNLVLKNEKWAVPKNILYKRLSNASLLIPRSLKYLINKPSREMRVGDVRKAFWF